MVPDGSRLLVFVKEPAAFTGECLDQKLHKLHLFHLVCDQEQGFFCHFLLFNDYLFLTDLTDNLSSGGGTSVSHNGVDTKRNQKGVVTFKHKLFVICIDF